MSDRRVDRSRSKSRRSSMAVSVGGHNQHRRASTVIDEEIDREEIFRTIISKEERRRMERAALNAQLEDDDAKTDDQTVTEVKKVSTEVIKCPYLDTINRKVLDFDFEKLCR